MVEQDEEEGACVLVSLAFSKPWGCGHANHSFASSFAEITVKDGYSWDTELTENFTNATSRSKKSSYHEEERYQGSVKEKINLQQRISVEQLTSDNQVYSPIYHSSSSSKGGRCNCRHTQCLKLYCECFANQTYCEDCNCANCFNTPQFEMERKESIASLLNKNPKAFEPKVKLVDNEGKGFMMVRHERGCHCKKSNCLKNYCECYRHGLTCSSLCHCIECKNDEHGENVSLRKPSYSALMALPSPRKRTRDSVCTQEQDELSASKYAAVSY